MPTRSAWRLRDTLAAAALFLASAAFTLWQNTRVAVLWDISYLLDTSYRFSLGQTPLPRLPLRPRAAHLPRPRRHHPHLRPRLLPAHPLRRTRSRPATLLTWRILFNLLGAPMIAEPKRGRSVLLGAGRRAIWGKSLQPPASRRIRRSAHLNPPRHLRRRLPPPHLRQRRHPRRPARPVPLQRATSSSRQARNCPRRRSLRPPALLQAEHRPALPPHHPCCSRRHRHRPPPSTHQHLTRSSGSSPAPTTLAAATPRHPRHRRPAQLPLLDHHLRRPAPPARPRVMLSTYRQASLLWTIPAAIAALALLRRSAPTAGPAPLAHPSPRLSVPLDHRRPRPHHDPDDRAGQLLSLWPHILILSAALAVWNLRPQKLAADPTLSPSFPPSSWHHRRRVPLPAALGIDLRPLASAHPAHRSSCSRRSPPSRARWPSSSPQPSSSAAASTPPATSASAISTSTAREAHATLPELRGLTTPGPWIPDFEELVRTTNAEIPANDGILLLPGEVPSTSLPAAPRSFPSCSSTRPPTPTPPADPRPGPRPQHPLAHRQPQPPAHRPAPPDLPEVITRVLATGLHPLPHPHQLRHLPPQIARHAPVCDHRDSSKKADELRSHTPVAQCPCTTRVTHPHRQSSVN
jgi:hypothetical protein